MAALRFLVVIPALNEEAALSGLLADLRALQTTPDWCFEAVVVDDGSTDRTSEVAAANSVRVLRLCQNLGIGAAVQTGIRLAHREGFHAAVQMDGDGQHPPLELNRLVARLLSPAAPDLVVGSRLLERRGYQATPARRLGQVWLTGWLRLVCGLRVSDPTSGFRVYGPRAVALFQQSYPYDFPEPESLAMAAACGLTIDEEPVEMRARQGGQSSIRGLTPLYYMLKVTLAVVLSYVRYRRGKRGVPAPRAMPAGGVHVE